MIYEVGQSIHVGDHIVTIIEIDGDDVFLSNRRKQRQRSTIKDNNPDKKRGIFRHLHHAPDSMLKMRLFLFRHPSVNSAIRSLHLRWERQTTNDQDVSPERLPDSILISH